VKILVNHQDAVTISDLRYLGFTEEEYRAVAEELAYKFKEPPSISDVVWGIISEKQLAAMKKGNWGQLQFLYWHQARLLFETGQDFFLLRQESAKCELRRYQAMDLFSKVEIYTPGDACSKCKALHGKIFTIKEALETMPIPVKDCENIWCLCIYLPIIE
jgi:hypothetical protein